ERPSALVLSPGGAPGCSHGWSGRRYSAVAAQPVGNDVPDGNCPEGAEGAPFTNQTLPPPLRSGFSSLACLPRVPRLAAKPLRRSTRGYKPSPLRGERRLWGGRASRRAAISGLNNASAVVDRGSAGASPSQLSGCAGWRTGVSALQVVALLLSL